MAAAWDCGGGSSSARLRGSISFAGLRVRYDKRADIHEAFLSLGCALDLLAVATPGLDNCLSPHGCIPSAIWAHAGGCLTSPGAAR